MPIYNNGEGIIKTVDELVRTLWLIKLSRCECVVRGKANET